MNTRRGVPEKYQSGESSYVLVSETPFAERFRPALFPELEIILSP